MDNPSDRCQISHVGEIVRARLVFLLSVAAVVCGAAGPNRAYSGDQLPAKAVTTLKGSYLHQHWLNRYIDAVRFARVDRKVIVKSAEHEPIEIKSGSHELPYVSADTWAVPMVWLLAGQLRGGQRVYVADSSL